MLVAKLIKKQPRNSPEDLQKVAVLQPLQNLRNQNREEVEAKMGQIQLQRMKIHICSLPLLQDRHQIQGEFMPLTRDIHIECSKQFK